LGHIIELPSEQDVKAIGVNLAEISQYIEISKIENLRYFGQAWCAEHDNFISIGFECHSVIWQYQNLEISQF
jgi:hypothetical protein